MQNDDLKRFYPQGGDSSDNNDFVRYDENGKIPYVDGKFVEKDTTSSTYPKVYVKWGDGTQGLENLTQDNTFNAVVRRKADGRISVPTPSSDGDCTNKKYCDDGFVAKQTGTSTYVRAYVKNHDGSQALVDVVGGEALGSSIVRRSGSGQVVCADPTATNHAATKAYVDDGFVAKQTGATSYPQLYCKKTDGTQEMRNVAYDLVSYGVPLRDSNGGIRVPTTPINNEDAASKAYVDTKIPDAPSEVGTYVLKAVVTESGTTYSWVAES